MLSSTPIGQQQHAPLSNARSAPNSRHPSGMCAKSRFQNTITAGQTTTPVAHHNVRDQLVNNDVAAASLLLQYSRAQVCVCVCQITQTLAVDDKSNTTAQILRIHLTHTRR
jgi:hypothetical protein